MRPDYSDILSKIPEQPKWWDKNGVPRYCKFEPKRSNGFYVVALFKINCQACMREFLVEVSLTRRTIEESPYLILENIRYDNDPPYHDCVGDTMSAIESEVVEMWDIRNKKIEWKRVPKYERKLPEYE